MGFLQRAANLATRQAFTIQTSLCSIPLQLRDEDLVPGSRIIEVSLYGIVLPCRHLDASPGLFVGLQVRSESAVIEEAESKDASHRSLRRMMQLKS